MLWLKEALDAGASARYVLFDSWFSNPRQLLDVLALKLHTIAMIKRSSKRYYEFEGETYDRQADFRRL